MEKANQALDFRTLGNRLHVTPDQVGESLIADFHRPVGRRSLIRTARRCCARGEHVHAHVFLRDVVAHRMIGFEEQCGRRVSATVWPSITTRTWRLLGITSTRLYGSRACLKSSSSSSIHLSIFGQSKAK